MNYHKELTQGVARLSSEIAVYLIGNDAEVRDTYNILLKRGWTELEAKSAVEVFLKIVLFEKRNGFARLPNIHLQALADAPTLAQYYAAAEQRWRSENPELVAAGVEFPIH